MSKKISAAHFWKWFERNNEDYLGLFNKSAREQVYLMNELDAHLRACSNLEHFGLEHDPDTGRGTLIINSGYKPSRFDAVDKFVAAAPYIAGWNILALDPPRPADFALEDQLEEAGIDPDRIWCTVYAEDPDDEVHLVIHFYEHDSVNQKQNEELMRRIIYNLLGERTYFQEIGAVICENMLDLPEESFIKIADLHHHVSRRKSSLVVTKDGYIESPHFDDGTPGIWRDIQL